jgi:outer membrane protein OmpA-like peptidoglycan-associated protein
MGCLTLAALTVVAGFGHGSRTAQAQTGATVYIGSNKPAVEVNLSVLDQLGKKPSLPGLLRDSTLGRLPPNDIQEALLIRNQGSGSDYFSTPDNLPMRPVENTASPNMAVRIPKPAATIAPVQSSIPRPAAVAAVSKKPVPLAAVKAPAKVPTVKVPTVKVPTVKVEAPEPKVEPLKTARATSASAPVAAKPAAARPATSKPAAARPATRKPAAAGRSDWQILFGDGEAELTSNAQAQIAKIIAGVGADSTVVLRIRAHADGRQLGAGNARRLALSRALKVRQALANAGFKKSRLKLEVIGDREKSTPRDRVDIKRIKN